MKCDHYQKNSLYVITAVGALKGQEAFEFNQYLKPIMEDLAKNKDIMGMIFDMKAVLEIDSSGLGAITGKLVRMKKLGKRFALTHVSQGLRTAFTAVNLEQSLTFYATTNEALHVLGKPDLSSTSGSDGTRSASEGFMRSKP